MDLKRPASAINIHIERLVVDASGARDARAVGASVRTELARLVAEGGLPATLASGGALAAVEAGSFQRPSGAKPSAIGREVARSVYRGLGR
jgi:hypothetical protein